MTRNERKIRTEQLKQRLTGQMPRVKFDIDPNDDVTGVSAISIVDNPAIGSGFVALTDKGAPKSKTASGELIRVPITNYVVL